MDAGEGGAESRTSTALSDAETRRGAPLRESVRQMVTIHTAVVIPIAEPASVARTWQLTVARQMELRAMRERCDVVR